MKTKTIQSSEPTSRSHTERLRGQVKKILIPHKHNDYRPHIMRLHGIIAVLVIALVAQISYNGFTTGRVSVLAASNIAVGELFEKTNQERQKGGLVELSLNEALTRAAELKASDMFEHNYWAHISPTGIEPWEWFYQTGYTYETAGENLAKNYPNATATVAAWMASEKHRANIMNERYVDVGFAVVDGQLEGQETTLIVALYGSPAPVGAPTASSSQLPNQLAAENNVSLQNSSREGVDIMTYSARILGALSPVAVAVLGLLGLVAIIGLFAHRQRDKLPKAWRKSWRRHHGMYTFVGMLLLGALVIVGSHTGQI